MNAAWPTSTTMDYGDIDSGGFGGEEELPKKPRVLPDDLPKSLDDRRRMPTDLVRETELYDGWQGMINLSTYPGRSGPHVQPTASDHADCEL